MLASIGGCKHDVMSRGNPGRSYSIRMQMTGFEAVSVKALEAVPYHAGENALDEQVGKPVSSGLVILGFCFHGSPDATGPSYLRTFDR